MQVLVGEKHQPPCIMAHEFINKLTAIIGNCDLIRERIEDAEVVERLAVTRSIAVRMADELKEHQCKLDSMIKMAMFGQETKRTASAFGKH